MKIVVLDGYAANPGDLSWEPFEKLGELTVYDRTPAGKVAERIGDAEIVLTNKVVLSEEVLDACSGIRYVGVLATGYNVIDVESAARRGIAVTNIPAYSTETVAQYTIAMILELCYHIGHHDRLVHQGRWTGCPDFCFWDQPMMELAGKTLGIIGFGSIGQAVSRIALAMGMNVLFNSRRRRPELEKENCIYATQDEIFASSHVITLHCPLTEETRNLICEKSIAKMMDGVILINNARGPLVNEADLADALNSGKVQAAGVDVVSVEPIKGDNPLLKARNCLITPHVAWAAEEARRRLMEIAVNNIVQFQRGTPVNLVNQL